MHYVLVIGSGARELAIIKKLHEDSNKENEEISIICIKTQDNCEINKFCIKTFSIETSIHETLKNIEENIKFCIIGPEAPLKEGYADYFEKKQIPCIGPLQYYAQIETSKQFCREFLHNDRNLCNYSPKYMTINKNTKTAESIKKVFDCFNEIVIKKDGLCGGKGVTVQGYDFFDKYEQIDYILNSNDTFVIEEKLEGEEFSFLTMTDGFGNVQHFPPIQDNKRLLEDDKGPNTGGMGCVIGENNTLPFLNEEDINITEKINTTVIHKLNKLKQDNKLVVGYRGVLYGSYIKTKNGIYIIEFNCRFGDPECIVALSLLETNFYSICLQTISGNLKEPFSFSKDAMICLYAVPINYPTCSDNDCNYDIYFEPSCNLQNIFYGNVKYVDNHIYSLRSRTLCCISKNKKLYDCYKNIYNDIKSIKGRLHYRKDIGRKFLTKYEQAGVSIQNGDQAIQNIKKNILSTYNQNVISEVGSFGGEYKFGNETLVASIDGVGTKSVLAKRFFKEEAFYNLGKDIVGHSINDILVQGAYPLFFLDYFGANSLNMNEFENFIQGITDSCLEFGPFPILGGETAEMPLIYNNDKTDLIGCIIGKKDNNFFPNSVKEGDLIINLPSVSPHTNGYSLINKIIDENIDNEMIKSLLTPHKCYLKEVLEFINIFGYSKLNAMCHITGGGFHGNIKRVLPENVKAQLYDIELPDWCNFLVEKGVSNDELFEVFNCGIGFVLIVDNSVDLTKFNITHKVIGKVENINNSNIILPIPKFISKKPRIAIIMGSDSDLPCMRDAATILEQFEIPYELTIVSAHRTPERLFTFAKNAASNGLQCIIAGAGGAAHLPGMVAALTSLPVIGVPIKSTTLSGNDSLLSIVQMPKGIPVATVAIHNATNAGLLACRILGGQDKNIISRMDKYMNEQEKEVLEKANILESIGYANYIKNKMKII